MGNVSAISGMYTKRSPYLTRFKNMDNEDSLSLTPSGKSDILALASKHPEQEELPNQLLQSTNDLKQNNLKH